MIRFGKITRHFFKNCGHRIPTQIGIKSYKATVNTSLKNVPVSSEASEAPLLRLRWMSLARHEP